MIQKPSKTFIKRGIIATAILLTIVLIQSPFFASLFKKKETDSRTSIESVQNLVTKDSNGNSIPDWEERFWGLDPTVESTNGRLHTDIISERKRILAEQSEGVENADLTQTDRLARDLFGISTIIGGSTNGNLEAIGRVAEQAADEFTTNRMLVDTIGADRMNTVSTTRTTVSTYLSELIRTLEQKPTTNEKEIIAQIVDGQASSSVEQLTVSIETYKKLSQSLTALPVPTLLAEEHLQTVNSINNMAKGIENFKTFHNEDVALSLIGFYQYVAEDARLSSTIDTLIEKSNSFFVLQ